jgi:hypothetical protein
VLGLLLPPRCNGPVACGRGELLVAHARATEPAGAAESPSSPEPGATSAGLCRVRALVRGVALLAGVLRLVALRLVGLLEVDDLIEDGREQPEPRSAQRA